ncbi:MAG TPA: hypothetical protein VMX76_00200 [Nevskiaceae bacterium]|nr:hypothetical protein [Nevskiaceae bacterium]
MKTIEKREGAATIEAEINRAYQEVLNYDQSNIEEIRNNTAVPIEKTSTKTGQAVRLGSLVLGRAFGNFPDYIKETKQPLFPGYQLNLIGLELSILLLVLKRHKPLKGLRDWFTDNLSLLYEMQGTPLRQKLTNIISQEQSAFEKFDEIIQKWDTYVEQFISLTDRIRAFCVESSPFASYPDRTWQDSKYISWLGKIDGKTLLVSGNLLERKR